MRQQDRKWRTCDRCERKFRKLTQIKGRMLCGTCKSNGCRILTKAFKEYKVEPLVTTLTFHDKERVRVGCRELGIHMAEYVRELILEDLK